MSQNSLEDLKTVLFIISNLQTGGVSKSLTSLMNVIDRERYEVSLMIVSPSGPLMELLPKDLRIITNPVWDALTNRLEGAVKLFRLGHPLLAAGHCIRLIMSRFSKSTAGIMIARMMPAINEDFDVIVDYNGQQQLYYMINKLIAKKKITFFHSDYAKWPYYYNADKRYYPKVDHIFTISDKCANSLKRFFPEQSDKIRLIENISSVCLIERMANVKVNEMDSKYCSLLTIGHVCENKGIYWAIEAASILKTRGIDFIWYFIGSVDKKDEYENLCRKKCVDNCIQFLGIKTNPYPYIKKATIIVHPSKFEGRSIALDEAKLLCKPVVVTNFSTVKDQFTDRVNASVCEMNPISIADSVEELLSHTDLQEYYKYNLQMTIRDNTDEINKLYKVFDE